MSVLRYILMDGCAAGRLAAEKAAWDEIQHKVGLHQLV